MRGFLFPQRGVRIMKMPEKSPDLWAAVIAWLSDHEYQLYAAGMGAAMGVLGVMYRGGGRRQRLLEGLICGLIGAALVPLMQWMEMPPSMAGFGACWVGFIGVEQIRAWAIRLGERRLDR